MSETMAPNMTVMMGTPNEAYMNMPWPMSYAIMNPDWQRNFEPNMPHQSLETGGLNSGVPKRLIKYENPITNIGESSYNNHVMTNSWVQQQMCNKRLVFGQKLNTESNCPIIANDNNAFGQNCDWLSTNKTVFNANNKQIFKGIRGQSAMPNAKNHFGRINNLVDFGVSYRSRQERQNIFPNANVRYSNGNSFAHHSGDNCIEVSKVSPHNFAQFPSNVMGKLTNSMENLLHFKETSKNFLTPQKSSDTFRSPGVTKSKSGGNFFLKESRLLQIKTPVKQQLFSTGSSFTESDTTTVTASKKISEVSGRISPQKRCISVNNNSELRSESPKAEDAPDLRHLLIAKRRKLDSNEREMESPKTTEGKLIVVCHEHINS